MRNKVISTLLVLLITIIVWVALGYKSNLAMAGILINITIIVFIWLQKKIVKGNIETVYIYSTEFPQNKKNLTDKDKMYILRIIENEYAIFDLQSKLKYEKYAMDIHTSKKDRTLRFCFNEEGELLIQISKFYFLNELSKTNQKELILILRRYFD